MLLGLEIHSNLAGLKIWGVQLSGQAVATEQRDICELLGATPQVSILVPAIN